MKTELDPNKVTLPLQFSPERAETIAQQPRVTLRPELKVHADPEALPRRADDELELGKTLGQGGMGVVYAGFQRSTGRGVAIKALRAEEPSASEVTALLREAWVTAALEHPNVVPIHDVVLDSSGRPLVVMKQVQGVEWSQVLDDAAQVKERFEADDLLEFNLGILMQVCRAVHFAHSRGVIHRDIKPSNVMIGPFGEVCLLDWGVAVSLRDDPSGRFPLASRARGAAGTPCYMCPEMVAPEEGGLSERSDVYLLGAVLYEIVARRVPHRGSNMYLLAKSIQRGVPEEVPGDVPFELRLIIERAMQPLPSARFASAEELRTAVASFVKFKGSRELAAAADRRLVELTSMLASDAEVSRSTAYKLFGECRFALQEALRSWPGNTRAQRALTQLVEQMIEYELREGQAGAAGMLLADLAEPSEALRQRVEQTLAQGERERRDLVKLRRDLDPNRGRPARRAITVAMGVAWVLAPLVANLVDPATMSRTVNLVSPLALLGLASGVWFFARRSLNQTAINRRVMVAMLVGFCAHMVHVLASTIANHPVRSELAMGMVSFGAITAILSHTAERRLWPFTIVYWLGAVASAMWRDQSAYVLSGCNLLLTAYLFVIWSADDQA